MSGITRDQYRALIETRVREPEALVRALTSRRRRSIAGSDGRLVIAAADHTARGMLAVAGDPLAVADRFTLLDRLVTCLAQPGIDGVLASADIMEDLAWLGALDDRLAIGTMNRGGVIGATWELDDRMTAYDPEHVLSMGLDGGKTLLRIDPTDAGVARTIESVAAASTRLADAGVMSMIEPLPYRKDATGRAVLDPSDDALITVVAIASGLGASSARTWLKVPSSDRMAEVAGATSLPVLMLGGDPGADAERVFARWRAAMEQPNVRGLVAGRTLLYPVGRDTADAAREAAAIVHGAAS